MIPFKVRKKNDNTDNRIFTVYDVENYSLNDYDTRFLIYASTIGRWVWVRAEAYEPVEEENINGTA